MNYSFQQLALKAPYFYSASHDLNLVLYKISDVQCMLHVMKTVGVLFEYFPKKKILLENVLNPLIELQWKMELKQYS